MQTFKFLSYSFMFIIYQEVKSSSAMVEGLDLLETILGKELFSKEVEVLKTDRGSEFKCLHKRTGGTVVIDGVHFDDAEIFIFIGIVDEIIICTSFEIFSVFSFFVIFLFVLILKSISRRPNSLNTPSSM